MIDIILNVRTRQALEAQLKNPSQAILFVGPQGAGKGTVAKWFFAQLLGRDYEQVLESPFVMTVPAVNKNIPIDSVRDINKFLKLKSISNGAVKQIVFIENLELMTGEAQNALLKNLEEPPAGTVFVLTAESEKSLMPTILSRLQIVKILPPNRKQLAELFDLPDAEFTKFYNLSGGLPGLFHGLLEESDKHPLAVAIAKARAFLAASEFERLKLASDYSGQKVEALELTHALKLLASAAIVNAAAKNEASKIRRWQSVLEASLSAGENLKKEANLKLVLINLALNL